MAALSKHAGAGLVAVLYLTLALAEGGFDDQLVAGATIVVWWVAIVGLVVRAWPGSEAPRAAVACGGSLAALVLVTALSLLWSDDAGRAFDELVRIAGYLGVFVVAVLASPRGSAPTWAGGIAAGLAAVAGLALLARFEPGLLTEGAGDLAETIPSSSGRLSYPIGYWNGLGAIMALAIVALAWGALRARGRAARAAALSALPLPVLALYLSQSLGGAVAAAVGVAVLVVAARERLALAAVVVPGLAGGGVLVLAASARSALVDAAPGGELNAQGDEMLAITAAVAILLGLVRFALDQPVARLREVRVRVRVPRVAIAAIGAVAVAAALFAIDPVERWNEFKDPGTLSEPPADAADQSSPPLALGAGNGRYQWWSAALEGWVSEPLTGVGAGNWELYWNANNTLPVVVTHAHSLFLETLAELGPVGLGCLLAFLATAILAGVGRRRSSRGEVAVWLALLAAGIASSAGEWTWEIPAATVPLVLAAAVLTGPATLRPRWPRAVEASGDGRRPVAEVATGSRFGLGVATMLAGFACIWVAGVSLLAGIQLDDSREGLAAGEYDEAARNANFAATIEPWSPEPRIELAGAEALRGRIAEAREAAADAVDRAPGDFRAWVVLARILARDGERDEAEEALARANRLSPVPLGVELPEPDA